jgi:hypothetical protein
VSILGLGLNFWCFLKERKKEEKVPSLFSSPLEKKWERKECVSI